MEVIALEKGSVMQSRNSVVANRLPRLSKVNNLSLEILLEKRATGYPLLDEGTRFVCDPADNVGHITLFRLGLAEFWFWFC